jgi:dolichyl-phosphate-mannose--protein O-mannosyl transferase
MPAVQPYQKDPLDWTAIIAVFFLALAFHRLDIPSKIYFDEVHYVIAARKLLLLHSANPEHPMLGKEIIAAAIALLGDKPLFWRIPSAVFGAFGLFAFGRLMWFSSRSRFATLSGMFLVATSFAWFIQSRIAMLDMFMASLGMVALWMFASAARIPSQGRWRLAISCICFWMAMWAKWSIAPIAMLPGLTFLALKIRDNGWRFLSAREGGPVPGITLIEAAFWLGSVPLAVYWLTYAPGFFFTDRPIAPLGFIEHHRYMFELQDSVKKLHPYRSVWYEWVGNWRAIWYLYEPVDGAQRGILLIGNPFTMLAGLPALLWCLWIGIRRRRWDALGFAVFYLVSLGLWIVTDKPIQFYYHYLLPGTFLMGCLALALDEIWKKGGWMRAIPLGVLAAAGGMFLYFYPIISAGVLHHGKTSYVQWMWLNSWR